LVFKQQIGSVKLIPGTGGVFEVSINGKNIYSKAATGQFPDFNQIVKEVQSRL